VAESLIVLLGGGKDKVNEGLNRFLALRKKQVNEYMQRLEVAGLGDRRQRMNPEMRILLEPPRN
jgi:hypothetical protein